MNGVVKAMLMGGVTTPSGSEVLLISLRGRGLANTVWLYQRREGVAVGEMTEDELCSKNLGGTL